MTTLADASLSADELRVVERFVELLREEFGPDLRAVWLYGSRARGERPHDESDVDLLVVLARDAWQDHWRASRLASEAAEAEGESPVWFSVQVYTPNASPSAARSGPSSSRTSTATRSSSSASREPALCALAERFLSAIDDMIA